MRQIDVAPPDQGLGAPIRPDAPKPSEPQWKPVAGHPEHEFNGSDIRLKQTVKPPGMWDFYKVKRPSL